MDLVPLSLAGVEKLREEVKYLKTVKRAIEADIKLNLISITSPIARAIIGKSEGDEVIVEAPSGKKYYEVVEVRYEG